jgi:hypothetical protein
MSINPLGAHAVVARNAIDFDAETGPDKSVLPFEVPDMVPDSDLVPTEDSSARVITNPDADTTARGSLTHSSLKADLHASSALGTAGRELSTDRHVASSGAACVSSSGAGCHAPASGAAHGSPLGADCGSSVA